MKNRSIVSLFFGALMGILIFSFKSASAQGNVTGNSGSWPPDYEIIWKCLDSLDLGTNKISFYEVHTLRAGQTTIVQAFRTSGASFTPPGGKQTVGDCAGNATVTLDTMRDLEISVLCDDNGPFYRLVQAGYKPGDANFTNPKILGNYTMSLGSYTPVGTVRTGDCASYDNSVQPTRFNLASALTFTGPWTSWEVHNTSLTIRTVTINGTATDLYPGETVRCAAYYDPVTNSYKRCPSFSATGSAGNILNVIHRP